MCPALLCPSSVLFFLSSFAVVTVVGVVAIGGGDGGEDVVMAFLSLLFSQYKLGTRLESLRKDLVSSSVFCHFVDITILCACVL